MLKSRTFAFTLVLMLFVCMTPFQGHSGAATSGTTTPTANRLAAKNKFVGRWSSEIRKSSGEVVNDGVLDISDSAEPNADEVSVVHSLRGGPVVGHTMGYPHRIEIQISLGDGRVAHYNGVLVSANRIKGRYFVTGNQQSHHAHSAVLTGDDWEATAIPPG